MWNLWVETWSSHQNCKFSNFLNSGNWANWELYQLSLTLSKLLVPSVKSIPHLSIDTKRYFVICSFFWTTNERYTLINEQSINSSFSLKATSSEIVHQDLIVGVVDINIITYKFVVKFFFNCQKIFIKSLIISCVYCFTQFIELVFILQTLDRSKFIATGSRYY